MTQKLQSQLKKYFANKNVQQVILFGSKARNTSTRRSDYDFIIIQKTDKRFFDRFDFFNDIYKILGNHVDMLIYNPVEWEEIKTRIFFKNILKYSVNIYVKGKKSV